MSPSKCLGTLDADARLEKHREQSLMQGGCPRGTLRFQKRVTAETLRNRESATAIRHPPGNFCRVPLNSLPTEAASEVSVWRGLVDESCASWNRVTSWLEDLERLRRPA
jgi:hypothetical protein